MTEPVLHITFPETASLAEQRVAVCVQHVPSSQELAALPPQYVVASFARLVMPDEQVWLEHVAFAMQHAAL